MGVTAFCDPRTDGARLGRFCSSASGGGGDDRFLLPSEEATFAACLKQAQSCTGSTAQGLASARAAVQAHLPRLNNDSARIREQATLVVLVASDRLPLSLAGLLAPHKNTCTLNQTTQDRLDAALRPTLNLFRGSTDPEAAAMFHIIGGVCNNSCGADVSHGYRDLARRLSGQIADICQPNLGNTMQVIIDSITGAASPGTLYYVPISASLAVALDARPLQRSRVQGFDFRPSSNDVVFVGVDYHKGSEVYVSYKYWRRLALAP